MSKSRILLYAAFMQMSLCYPITSRLHKGVVYHMPGIDNWIGCFLLRAYYRQFIHKNVKKLNLNISGTIWSLEVKFGMQRDNTIPRLSF